MVESVLQANLVLEACHSDWSLGLETFLEFGNWILDLFALMAAEFRKHNSTLAKFFRVTETVPG